MPIRNGVGAPDVSKRRASLIIRLELVLMAKALPPGRETRDHPFFFGE